MEPLTEVYHQLYFLAHSASLYDKGYFPEAKRMANAIAILLIDRKNSTSLLTQCPQLSTDLLSTERTRILEDESVIVGIGVDKWGVYEALNSEKKATVRREQWLDELIWRNKEFSISRKDLILAIRDQHGGAHFDPKWKKGKFTNFLDGFSDVKYALTETGIVIKTREDSFLYVVKEAPPENSTAPKITSDYYYIANPDFATMRQITNEVLESIINFNNFSELKFLVQKLQHRKVFLKSIVPN